MIDQSATAIEVVQRIRASPEIVFRYFTDGARMVQWFGKQAQLDARPGGRFRIAMPEGQVAIGEYREVDPPRRLIFTWGWEGSATIPPGSTTIEVTLTADGDGTLVRLRHIGLPDETSRKEHLDGWTGFVRRLSEVV